MNRALRQGLSDIGAFDLAFMMTNARGVGEGGSRQSKQLVLEGRTQACERITRPRGTLGTRGRVKGDEDRPGI